MTDLEKIILKERLISTDGKLYNFLQRSVSSEFYDGLFSHKKQETNDPEFYKKLKTESREKFQPHKIMEEIMVFLEKKLDRDAVVIEIGGGYTSSVRQMHASAFQIIFRWTFLIRALKITRKNLTGTQ